jgi:hypothetical protein
MSENENLLGQFINKQVGRPAPETREINIEREVLFGQNIWETRGSLLSVGSLSHDEIGVYVPVKFGFGTNHTVSHQIAFRDRRTDICQIAKDQNDILLVSERGRLRALWSDRITRLEKRMEYLSNWKPPGNDELIKIKENADNLRESLFTQPWTIAQSASRELLINKLQTIEEQLSITPDKIQSEFQLAHQELTSLRSQLINYPDLGKPDLNLASNAQNKINMQFQKIPGNIRKIIVSQKYSYQSQSYYDITDADIGSNGLMLFRTGTVHVPKGAATLAELTLEFFFTYLDYSGSNLFSSEEEKQKTLPELVRKSGGFYEGVWYSSRTGHHQGFGYWIAVPNPSILPKDFLSK